jgi:hypothetical protein
MDRYPLSGAVILSVVMAAGRVMIIKLKLGVRVNSSAVEAEGNILFRSLQFGPLKLSFNHLTSNFADEDFEFVSNSISLYDIDHATLIGGGAGPLFLKSTVNLSGTASKSQAARVITVRLREELGGINPEEWKRARQISFRTTVLALNTEPGMVCSMTHPDMSGGQGEFRVTGWRLNRDYSIDIQGRSTSDSMYDLVTGPKPADVVLEPPAEEVLIDTGVPGVLTGIPGLGDYGTFAIDDMTVAPDASGNTNIVGAHEITLALYYVGELTTDLWASIGVAIDATTDPVAVVCTVVFNDESADPENPGRRSYECAQITGPGAPSDVVPSGELVNNEGYGLRATRRLPYADYGLALISAVTAGPDPQTLQTVSYCANRLGLVAGGFIFLDPGGANEEYVRVISADPQNQSFQAIVTKDHSAGELIRPTIWPTPVLYEGDDMAFDILAVVSPDSGSDLTVVIPT